MHTQTQGWKCGIILVGVLLMSLGVSSCLLHVVERPTYIGEYRIVNEQSPLNLAREIAKEIVKEIDYDQHSISESGGIFESTLTPRATAPGVVRNPDIGVYTTGKDVIIVLHQAEPDENEGAKLVRSHVEAMLERIVPGRWKFSVDHYTFGK